MRQPGEAAFTPLRITAHSRQASGPFSRTGGLRAARLAAFGLLFSLWLPLSGIAVDPLHGAHEAEGVVPRGAGGGGRASVIDSRSLALSLLQTGWLRALPWWPDAAGTLHGQPFADLWQAPLRQAASGQPVVSDGQFVWGPNAADFDPRAYLQGRASPLLPYADHLALWADYSSVNPQVLLAVLEIQLGWVNSIGPSVTADQIRDQIESTAMDLAMAFYEHLYIWGARRPAGQSAP
ncbi:MAG TPA: hypothetical protein VJ345_06575, partial [Anaerolineales bacterium]|nr:hypothetical protein [Anaerolineales bacterium]